jgi:hypothetical protein
LVVLVRVGPLGLELAMVEGWVMVKEMVERA